MLDNKREPNLEPEPDNPTIPDSSHSSFIFIQITLFSSCSTKSKNTKKEKRPLMLIFTLKTSKSRTSKIKSKTPSKTYKRKRLKSI